MSIVKTFGLKETEYEDIKIGEKEFAIKKLKVGDILKIKDSSYTYLIPNNGDEDAKVGVEADKVKIANMLTNFLVPNTTLEALSDISKELDFEVEGKKIKINNLKINEYYDITAKSSALVDEVEGYSKIKINDYDVVMGILNKDENKNDINSFEKVSSLKKISAWFQETVKIYGVDELYNYFRQFDTEE